MPPEVERNVAVGGSPSPTRGAPLTAVRRSRWPREQTLTLRSSGFWSANDYIKPNDLRIDLDRLGQRLVLTDRETGYG